MATHRRRSAAEFIAQSSAELARTERDTRATPKLTAAPALPEWMMQIRQVPANDIANVLPAKRATVYECPKCHELTMRVEGPRWRCTAAECARRGDVLELISRGLHGAVYFRLSPSQKRGVRRWCEDFLRGAEL